MASNLVATTPDTAIFDQRSSMTVDRGQMVNDLLDTKTIAVYISDTRPYPLPTYNKPHYYLPEGLFNGLALEFTNSSAQDPILTSDNAFRILVIWLLYRDLDNVTEWCTVFLDQGSLAEAWNLGANYDIPEFQNEVMHMLFLNFDLGWILEEAYRTTKRDTKLQQACVAHIVLQKWTKEDFTEQGLDKIPGFCLDVAVRSGASRQPLHVRDFLVNEDGEDEESATDG